MTAPVIAPQTLIEPMAGSIKHEINSAVQDMMASLPSPAQLTAPQQRAIISRYTAVLEGNFIYWMTGAYLAVKTDQARSIILENLHEEVRDSHPRMLRTFALAANAMPTESDAMAIHKELTDVRFFIGRLSAVPIVITMAFFEGFIQKFMDYLAELAAGQGSTEREYTDVHGVCDITHTEELYHALAAEIAMSAPDPSTDLFEGVKLLRALIESVIDPTAARQWAQPIC